MIPVREFPQTFIDLPLGGPATVPVSGTAIFLDDREAVDAAVTAGLAAGGSEAQPASDYGFMYQRQLTDRTAIFWSSATWIRWPPSWALRRHSAAAGLIAMAQRAIRRLISGELTPDRAIATGVVEVLGGRRTLLRRFASTFHLAA